MKRITEEPFKGLVDREWKRAKRLLPALKRKPKVVWVQRTVRTSGYGYQYLSGHYGMCHRSKNLIQLREEYKSFKDKGEFIRTLRHEFAHLLRPSYCQSGHGQDFMWWCKRLGGTRWATSFKTLAEQDPH